jgi:SAM-dependent methyltransferase
LKGFSAIDWYSTPLYYDLVFAEDTQKECDFLEEALRRFGRVARHRGPKRVLEPACGSGRLVEAMTRRGFDVTGFDASEEMVAFTKRRLATARPRPLAARVELGRMESFRYREKFDLAHCFVSTFKYLRTERAARSHLRCVARTLRPGGLYVLGFHLSDYASNAGDDEHWVARRGGVHVVCDIRSWPPERELRRERVRCRLVVDDRGRAVRNETHWWFRTYDAAPVRALLRAVPEFEHVATRDFWYDWSQPRELDDTQLDTVLVLRRR